jgi:hypothetical protein
MVFQCAFAMITATITRIATPKASRTPTIIMIVRKTDEAKVSCAGHSQGRRTLTATPDVRNQGTAGVWGSPFLL